MWVLYGYIWVNQRECATEKILIIHSGTYELFTYYFCSYIYSGIDNSKKASNCMCALWNAHVCVARKWLSWRMYVPDVRWNWRWASLSVRVCCVQSVASICSTFYVEAPLMLNVSFHFSRLRKLARVATKLVCVSKISISMESCVDFFNIIELCA